MSYPTTTPIENEQELTNGLFVIELEERLEMVQAAASEIVVSCCLDSAA
jgi:hypothetical protein